MVVVEGRKVLLGNLSLDQISLVVRFLMGERREDGVRATLVLGEVPSVVDGLGETADHRLALLGDGLSVGVLMAHHHDGFTVDGKLVVELGVATFEVADAAVKDVEGLSVLLDELSVVRDVTVVAVDVLVVVSDGLAGVVDALLETSNGLTESFGTDEHVTGLGNLQLVSVLTEEGAVGIESIDGLGELRGVGVSGGGRLVATVMVMARVVVVVVIVQLVVIVGEVAMFLGASGVTLSGSGSDFSLRFDLEGRSGSDKEKRSKYFHFSFDFTIYSD